MNGFYGIPNISVQEGQSPIESENDWSGSEIVVIADVVKLRREATVGIFKLSNSPSNLSKSQLEN